jgi:hypothetical protein
MMVAASLRPAANRIVVAVDWLLTNEMFNLLELEFEQVEAAAPLPVFTVLHNSSGLQHSWVFNNVLQTSKGVVIAAARAPVLVLND